MSKKYFFLSGLPRSGNTLLSSLFNQNPDIAVSANSLVPEIFANTLQLQNTEIFQNFPDYKSLESFIENIFNSYYQGWNAKYIIDRGPWGTLNNLQILKTLFTEQPIKIICTVRSITEIIASFIKADPVFLQQQIEFEYQNNLRFFNHNKTLLEIKCEIVTKSNGQLEKNLAALSNLLQPENQKYLHLVEYTDLINDPEKTVQDIYSFLNLPKFKHSFDGIKQFEANEIQYDDSIYGCSLHGVKPEIKKPDYNVCDILTPELIQKYSGKEFWRTKTGL
jgi:sulfotransferase